jgi:predicted MPP superfamily phosphohydrolase
MTQKITMADGDLVELADDRAAMAPGTVPLQWASERRRIESSSYWVSPAGRRSRWRSRLFRAALSSLTFGTRIVGLHALGRRNALAPQLVQFELGFPALPAAFDGYRILHLSDTHLDAQPELATCAGQMLAGIEVDLVALTGDILAAHDARLALATEPLAYLLKDVVVRDRHLAVLGNHDPAVMADALEPLGFEVLLNRSIVLERRGDRIAFTGLDDVHCFYTDAAHAALFDAAVEDFRIALVHSPEMADHAADAGIGLYLCGHTHGGQICLPGGRPLLTQLTRCRYAARGLWRCGSMVGYTSRGLGTAWPTLRYNCPSEMTLITLRKGAPTTEAKQM